MVMICMAVFHVTSATGHHLSIVDQLIEYEQKLITNEFFSRLIGRAPSKLVDSHDLIKLTPQLPGRERERDQRHPSN